MRKIITVAAMSAAALAATAGAASASTGTDAEAEATNVNHEHNHVNANGAGSLINVSDVLTNSDVLNGLLAGGVNVDADVLDEGVNVG